MTGGKQRVIQAIQQCEEEGHERDDGKWVDPLPVQKVSIEEGFKVAASDDEFDIWTVVNPTSTLREGDAVGENFQRVFDQWANTAEKSLDESAIKERLKEMEQDGDG